MEQKRGGGKNGTMTINNFHRPILEQLFHFPGFALQSIWMMNLTNLSW